MIATSSMAVRCRSPAFRFAAPRALGSRPEALNAQPSLLRRLVEVGGVWKEKADTLGWGNSSKLV